MTTQPDDSAKAWEKVVSEARTDGFGCGILWSILVVVAFYAAVEAISQFFRGDRSEGWFLLAAAVVAAWSAFKLSRRCLR